MRSRYSPLYVEIRASRGHIFRGLFYEQAPAGLRVVIEVDGEQMLESGPWPAEADAFTSFERYVAEAQWAIPAKVDLSEFKKKGAQLFVAKESGKWSIVAGLPSGKFVDTELRFDSEEQAKDAVR